MHIQNAPKEKTMATSLAQTKQSMQTIKTDTKTVAVVGATGYTGQELLRLLMQHPKVQVKRAVSHSHGDKSLASVYPSFQKATDLILQDVDLETLSRTVDLIFLALPHGHAANKLNADILKNCKVIDLGGDFRLKSSKDYETWYGFKHPHPELLSQAVYGLPELNRAAVKKASLIANPGCYATCSILTLAPLLMAKAIDPKTIIIDAKSAVSGAGRSTDLGTHFNECNESIKAYKVASHRHTPEIEQVLSAYSETQFCTSFTPHLIPMNRGILITAYASLLKKMTSQEIFDIYKSFYGDELFIRLFTPDDAVYKHPETRWVKGSNYCDIGLTVDQRTDRVIAIGAIDNLVKGAAGQAIQNMNLIFAWPENSGLMQTPIFPV